MDIALEEWIKSKRHVLETICGWIAAAFIFIHNRINLHFSNRDALINTAISVLFGFMGYGRIEDLVENWAEDTKLIVAFRLVESCILLVVFLWAGGLV